MYFQKLESLSQQESYKTFTPIIDVLDSWLAFLPKSQKDRILPEYFSNKEDIPLKIIYRIFDKLIEEGMLKERYVLRCSNNGCNHVICFADDLPEVREYIYNHNNNESECDFCEEVNQVTIENVFVIYRLLDSPRDKSLKKNFPLNDDMTESNGRNLKDRFIDNPEMYDKNEMEELLKFACSDL